VGLLLLAGAARGGPVATACDYAASRCQFAFVDSASPDLAPFFDIVAAPADAAFTSRIEWKQSGLHLGIINANHLEPEDISEGGLVTPLSALTLRSGADRFSPTFFKPFCEEVQAPVAEVGEGEGKVAPAEEERCYTSGIGRENFQRGQEEEATDRCIRVWLTQWQYLDEEGGSVIDNAYGQYDKSKYYCVVFRT